MNLTNKCRAIQNPELWKVWNWCLTKASHEECYVSYVTGRGITEIRLAVRQFVFGRNSSANELKTKPSTLRNRMNKLQRLGLIEIKPHAHCSVVTIKD